ncbi:hypothetical protein [Limosilactobacillus kribbianus]|uniref:hypothetical protein n=1 Tax=Limosilactobacillus kribbianus TaxID=2982695 RepID=UPI002263B921|nr:hypothetical protein [Limosilactobacillus kribbianus]
MSTIINAIPSYIMTAVISTVFYFGLKEAQTLIYSKVLHAQTERSRALWNLIDQLSEIAVNSLVGKNMSGTEKFAQATQIVQSALDEQEFTNVNIKAIQSAKFKLPTRSRT